MEPLQDQVLSDSQEDEDSSTETTRRRIETQIMRAKMEHMRRQDLKRQVSSLNYDGILNSHVSMIGEIAASLPKHSDDPNVVWDRLLKRT